MNNCRLVLLSSVCFGKMMYFQSGIRELHLPTQWRPSPKKPGLHLHSKWVSVFIQSASSWQLSRFKSHSLKSVKYQAKHNQINVCTKCKQWIALKAHSDGYSNSKCTFASASEEATTTIIDLHLGQ